MDIGIVGGKSAVSWSFDVRRTPKAVWWRVMERLTLEG